MSPNMPSLDNAATIVRLPIDLMARLRRRARERNTTISAIVVALLARELARVPLGRAERAWADAQRAANAARRAARVRLSVHRKTWEEATHGNA